MYEKFDSIVNIETVKNFLMPSTEQSFGESLYQLARTPYIFGPVYSLGVRSWSEFFLNWTDNSLIVNRSFSSLIGVLAIAATGWLVWEIAKSYYSAAIAAALVAVSPLHLQYSQIIRPYSLITLLTLVSSAVLLRSILTKKLCWWLVYATALTLGIYTSPLFFPVIVSHALYVFLHYFLSRTGSIRSRFHELLQPFCLSALSALALFLPWLRLFLKTGMLEYATSQSASKTSSLGKLGKSWLKLTGNIFVDLYDPWQVADFMRLPNLVFLLLVVAVLGFSFGYLVVRVPRKHSLFVLTLLAGGVALMYLDVVSGGIRSTRARYLLPTIIALELMVAFLLTDLLVKYRQVQKAIAQLVFSGLVMLGLASSISIVQAPSWWSPGNPYYHSFAALLERFNDPLVVVDSPDRALALSSLIDDRELDFLFLAKDFQKLNALDREAVFLLDVTHQTLENISSSFRGEVKRADLSLKASARNKADVWQLIDCSFSGGVREQRRRNPLQCPF